MLLVSFKFLGLCVVCCQRLSCVSCMAQTQYWDLFSWDSQLRVACCSSSSASVQGEDDIRNVYGPHIIGLAEKNLHTQKALARKSKLALIDPSEVLSIILAHTILYFSRRTRSCIQS